jgi:outer membrane receptor for ferric coprogen and ferric-rhodotorulic acid
MTGFEADIRLVPLAGLEMSAGLALLDARYGRFPDALLGSPGGGVPVVVGDASRNKVPFSPKAVFNLAASYSRPIGTGRLVLDATYLHSSRVVFEPDNVVTQGAYSLLNATGRYELGGGRRWLSVYGRNLTNEAVTRAALTIPSGQQINILHPPRTFGVEFGVRY